jgi:hypothetical protein
MLGGLTLDLSSAPLGKLSPAKGSPRLRWPTAFGYHVGGLRRKVSESRIDGLCGKTRKMTGRENLDFSRRTSSARVIVTMRPLEDHTQEDRPRGGTPAEFSFKAVYGGLNCDRREKTSFSTQSTFSGHTGRRPRTPQLGG